MYCTHSHNENENVNAMQTDKTKIVSAIQRTFFKEIDLLMVVKNIERVGMNVDSKDTFQVDRFSLFTSTADTARAETVPAGSVRRFLIQT